MSRCNILMQAAGWTTPSTCERCGLGPCETMVSPAAGGSAKVSQAAEAPGKLWDGTVERRVDLRAYASVGCEVFAEVARARDTLGFPPMNSAHEGFAVIQEEVDELWEHVRTNQKRRDLDAMRKEAIQVAAMALAFAVEVCTEERGRR